jgi:hypothetical protein
MFNNNSFITSSYLYFIRLKRFLDINKEFYRKYDYKLDMFKKKLKINVWKLYIRSECLEISLKIEFCNSLN